MQRLLVCFIVTFSLAVVCNESVANHPAPRKPNILFLLADDQTATSIHALGNSEISTPNLDRLAARGTSFSHCYNMGGWNGAICVASRAMLMSGRSLWNAQAIHGQTASERKHGRWWPEYMKSAGYRTYTTGKWHIPDPPENTFDVVRHVRPGMPTTVDTCYDRPRDGKPDPWSPDDESLGGFWEGGTHWSKVCADDAVGFLADAAQHSEPFFLYVAFNAPHDPRQSPREFVEKYPPHKIELPENFLPQYPYKDAIGCDFNLRDEHLAPFPRTEHAVKVHRSEYYAAISYLDAQIGRILEELDRTGNTENTWIFFTADHGLAVGEHGLLGKQNMYDHSVRVPFLVVGPGVPTQKQLAEPIYMQDVMPTALELAGIAKPQHVNFHSILPMLLDGATSPYDSIYAAYMDLQRMVIADGYKLIVYPAAKRVRLYHVADDPHERHDLSDESTHRAKIARLGQLLQAWHRRTDDPLSLADLLP